MNIQLISEIVRGVWLIGEEYKPPLLSMAKHILDGKMAFEKQDPQPYASYYDDDTSDPNSSLDEAPKILIINLQGVMVKYDQPCGVVGMESLAKTIESARTDDRIIGAIIVGDTPGGSVAGTQTLADSIWQFHNEKPIVGLVNGNVASAGYWALSQCNEIYLSKSLDSVGSIGVMATFFNQSKAMEMIGLEEIKLYSSLSPDKNSIYDRILSSDQAIRQAAITEFDNTVLTPIAKTFHKEVLKSRQHIDKSALTGKVYMSEDAIRLGMADGIKSLSECISRVIELSSKNKSQRNQPSSKNLNSTAMKKREKLASVIGVFELDAEGFASFDENALDSIEQAFVNSSEQLTQVQNSLNTANQRIQALEDTATSLNTTHANEIASRDEEIATLKEQILNLKGTSPTKQLAPSSKSEVTETVSENALESLETELQGMTEDERISYMQSRLEHGNN